MTRYAGWLVVVAAFIGLSFLVGNDEPATVTWKSGNDIQSFCHTEDLIGVRGTVDRVTTKHTGARAVKIICDDGAPATAIIMPTIDVLTPHTGDRIEVSGKLLDSGVINVTRREQLTVSVPDFVQGKRRMRWSGYLTNRQYTASGACTGSVVDGNNHYIGYAMAQRQVQLPTVHTPMVMSGYMSPDGSTFVIEDVSL